MQWRAVLLLVFALLCVARGKDVIIEQPQKGCRAVDVVAMAFFGKEAAMSACLFKHQQLVDVIAELNTGEPTDAPQKATPLMAAAAKGELVVVQSLARRKALVDKSVPEQGLTPLMMAASQGHNHIITSLMKDFQPPANLEMININGATALMLAANAGQASTVELLLSLGARSDPIAQRRLTALMMACTHGHHLAARALLDKKARQSARMDSGETALLLASRNGHELTVAELLGARNPPSPKTLNAVDAAGRTALMHAAERGYEGIVKRLLAHNRSGARVRAGISDLGKSTASSLAAARGHDLIASLLVDAHHKELLEDGKKHQSKTEL